MRIWQQPLSVDILNAINEDTVVRRLGIEFLEVGDDFLRARVPVDARTASPMGLLHGGVSVVLAETLGSLRRLLCLPRGPPRGGAGHQRQPHSRRHQRLGDGHGAAVHIGRTTQVWQIDMRNDAGELTCVSRITMAVLAPRPEKH
jgi:1,4-dihydroxy-2-naphthoyl-CoA hydrolase